MAYLLLFTGKGGVGKSTISASTAVYHASQGLRTLLVSSDPAHSTDDTLGIKVGSEATQVSENLWAKNLNAESLMPISSDNSQDTWNHRLVHYLVLIHQCFLI